MKKDCSESEVKSDRNKNTILNEGMDIDFERSDFFEDLLADDGSLDAKMGLTYSPDSGHGSPQSFTSSSSSSTVGHFVFLLACF